MSQNFIDSIPIFTVESNREEFCSIKKVLVSKFRLLLGFGSLFKIDRGRRDFYLLGFLERDYLEIV